MAASPPLPAIPVRGALAQDSREQAQEPRLVRMDPGLIIRRWLFAHLDLGWVFFQGGQRGRPQVHVHVHQDRYRHVGLLSNV